ncbi:glutathione S-transferase 2-like isoform X2 [Chenopodium quinoa]|uniref:glutathione S-transferase 2-like isoform X2 n=1 Tax=Chenopodium quinoa TaxID=63459 RepID=UPI000B772EC6|nr:glutathione S-transferase 2-like isoform X2 [Chenopodium quinoa]
MKATESSSCSASTSRVLYSFWLSSCSWRVRFALNLKEFEKINPLGYVPVLVDDGVVVSDSLAILMYLEDKYPQNQLLPADPCRRALSLQAASIVSCSMQPLHMKSVLEHIEKKVGQEESITWSQTVIEKGFSALEKLLKDFAGRYSTGDEVSMADVFLAPQISIAMDRFKTDMVIRSILHYAGCMNHVKLCRNFKHLYPKDSQMRSECSSARVSHLTKVLNSKGFWN